MSGGGHVARLVLTVPVCVVELIEAHAAGLPEISVAREPRREMPADAFASVTVEALQIVVPLVAGGYATVRCFFDLLKAVLHELEETKRAKAKSGSEERIRAMQMREEIVRLWIVEAHGHKIDVSPSREQGDHDAALLALERQVVALLQPPNESGRE